MLAFLGLAAVGGAAVVVATVKAGPSWADGAGLIVLAASALAGTIAVVLARRSGSWHGTGWVAFGFLASATFQLAGWIGRGLVGRPTTGAIFAGALVILLIMVLGAFVIDFLDHVRRGRVELVADVGLVATLIGAAVFVFVRHHAEPMIESAIASIVTTILSVGGILVVAGWGVLAMWVPSIVHVGVFGSGLVLAGTAIVLTHARQFGWDPSTLFGLEIATAVGALSYAGVLAIMPRQSRETYRPPHANDWVRPLLITLALGGAAATVIAELVTAGSRVPLSHTVVLSVAVFGTVGVRLMLNHVATSRAARALTRAYRERERAFASLRDASEAVSASEARHRLVLEAAVDGIVELDADGTIVRANEAFRRMVGLAADQVVGKPWAEMARGTGDGDSLERLPETGEATLTSGGGSMYLEAPSSVLPTLPSGRLLLIRDVTAGKTSDRTIRKLLRYLQDRDEDRTRLLARSNAAIEAERNRIARDLHDGPIQGVSAAALSLETVRLHLDRSELAEASAMLSQIVGELGDEAKNLRRIMSDLRPPVLEERGLFPAVRELCLRLGRELQIHVSVTGSVGTEVPRELESLAYRIVQEALTNVGKHARAGAVAVRISSGAATLSVEVTDDGRGFDPDNVREFLRVGKVGLASMRERTELAGGSFSVRSSPAGTTVGARIPFDALDRHD